MHRTSAKTTDNAQQWSVTTTDQAHPAHAKWLAQDTSTASTDTNAMRSYKMSSNNGKSTRCRRRRPRLRLTVARAWKPLRKAPFAL